ncbi:hypothetical protein VHUM_00356 [Vanrija humicola]|uniref:Calcium-channel protein CCH1 n=1 Tax=Vanrija humicola TaxID=5417 RepID=A0A7D8V3K3_VANHU|nr:hypothetical protein VHUM_00356 [Vanrija humicola]
MFIAVINENFEVAEEQKRKQQIENFIRKSAPVSTHVTLLERLNPYRLLKARHKAVRVDALPPNLILPLKQSIGADVGAPVIEDESTGTNAALRRLFGMDPEGDQSIPLRNLNAEKRKSTRMATIIEDEFDTDRGLTDLLPPLHGGPSADEHMDALRERRNQQADFIAAHPSYDRSLWIFSNRGPIRNFCQALVPPAYGFRINGRPAHPFWSLVFKFVIFATVVSSVVVAAISTPLYRKQYYAKHGYHHFTWFDSTELALAVVFVLEFFIKIIADGFIFSPNAYLLSIWNLVDLVILGTIIVNTTTAILVVGGLSRTTRAFKAFRALRLVTLFARLRDTFHAVLFAGMVRIIDACVLMILYLIPFAVWGLNIFSGLLASCNDTSGDVLFGTECVGEFSSSPVGDFNFLAPRVWANPAFGGSIWAFDSFRQSMLILFEIVSLEGWTDVMASTMNIVGEGQQPQTNNRQWNSIFFIIFNLFGGVIILTIFLSIIIENFKIRSGSALLTVEQKQWVDMELYIKQQVPSKRPRRRPGGFRGWCYDRTVNKTGYWARFFTFLYFVHIFLLMTQDYSNNIMSDRQLDSIFLAFIVAYAVDILVNFYGLGFKSFRTNGWNIYDVVVIIGCFVTTIPAIHASSDTASGLANKQVQKLFLTMYCLKLVQRLDSLNQLFKTSIASLPAIGNLFLLWAVLFIFFAIVDVEIFGLTRQGGVAESRYQNYNTFGNALIMLSFCSTGEGWNGYMHDYTIEFPRCTDSSNYLNSDCGSVGWAYVLFCTWNVLSMYIFLNMFTGVVVDSFAYVYQKPTGTSLTREQIRLFKKAWSEVDKNRTGYIKRKDFANFFSKLTGVFEARLYPVDASVPNIIRASSPDPHDPTAKLYTVESARHTVDTRNVEEHIDEIDFKKVTQRRKEYVRLFYEARISEEPGRGIAFTDMLLMLAHYKLINDDEALQVKDLLERRAKLERVDDLVNLDRVRGLLRTIYWRRRFLKQRNEKLRILMDEQDGMPAIVLEPMSMTSPPASAPTSPLEGERNPFLHGLGSSPISPIGSPPIQSILIPGTETPTRGPPSPNFSPSSTPTTPTFPHSPSTVLGHSAVDRSTVSGHIPSLSVSTVQRPGSFARRSSNDGSHLSSDGGHRRLVVIPSQLSPTDALSEPSVEEPTHEDLLNSMATSVWGDMMREAVDHENESDELK